MILSDAKKLVTLELSRFSTLSLSNIMMLFLYISYFYIVPKVIFLFYPYLPWENKHLIYSTFTYFSHLLAYLSINFLYYKLYTTFSETTQSWKICPAPWPWENKEDFKKLFTRTIQSAALMQLIISPITLILFGASVKYDTSLNPPEFLETMKQLAFFIVVEDFSFYWLHRLLHTPWLYAKIHKQHHEYKVTISIAAEYAHPVEYVVGNSLPVALGPLLYGQERVHLIVWVCWVFFRTVNTAEGHSGLDVPWSAFKAIPLCTSNEYHDFHHSKNQGNYGSFFMIWDTLFGTNGKYFEYLDKKTKKN